MAYRAMKITPPCHRKSADASQRLALVPNARHPNTRRSPKNFIDSLGRLEDDGSVMIQMLQFQAHLKVL